MHSATRRKPIHLPKFTALRESIPLTRQDVMATQTSRRSSSPPRILGVTLFTPISDIRRAIKRGLGIFTDFCTKRSVHHDDQQRSMGIEQHALVKSRGNKRRPLDDFHDRPAKRTSLSPEHRSAGHCCKRGYYDRAVKMDSVVKHPLLTASKTSPIASAIFQRDLGRYRLPGAIHTKSPEKEQADGAYELASQLMCISVKDEEKEDEYHTRLRQKEEQRRAAQREIELKRAAEIQHDEEAKIRRAIKKKRLVFERLKRDQEEVARKFQQEKDEYEKYVEKLRKEGAPTNEVADLVSKVRRDKYGWFPELPPKKRFLAQLSEEWESKIQAALAISSHAHVIGKSTDGTSLSRKDLARVLPGEPWLNDEIINAWYANLCARLNAKDGYVKGPTKTPRWVAYSSAWFPSASERGVNAIQGWSKRKGIKGEKLLQTERIFFPTNSGAHWTLLMISGKNKTIEYLDSMNEAGWKSRRYIKLALEWLKMELGAKFKEEEWTILQTKSAQQNNMNDCGVFACLNGWAMVKGSKDPSLEFMVTEIPLARKMLVATLMNGGFTGDFEL